MRLRPCVYCGRLTPNVACRPHADLPELDPGPGDPPGFVPRVRSFFWQDYGAVNRAVARRFGLVLERGES